MDRNDIVMQLASRMNSDELDANMWLEATMDVLNGVFTGQAPLARNIEGTPPQAMSKVMPLLRAATATTRLSINHEEIRITRFPFRVGRETRTHLMSRLPGLLERRNSKIDPNNELYIRDMGRHLNVSREHFYIERKGDGSFEVVDRGSACGTRVGSNVIGGEYTGGALRVERRRRYCCGWCRFCDYIRVYSVSRISCSSGL